MKYSQFCYGSVHVIFCVAHIVFKHFYVNRCSKLDVFSRIWANSLQGLLRYCLGTLPVQFRIIQVWHCSAKLRNLNSSAKLKSPNVANVLMTPLEKSFSVLINIWIKVFGTKSVTNNAHTFNNMTGSGHENTLLVSK